MASPLTSQAWTLEPAHTLHFMHMKLLSFSGTASDDIASAIDTYKKGHPYKCDKDGIIDIGVGKVALHF